MTTIAVRTNRLAEWNGLTPGSSQIGDAIAVLGQPTEICELFDGTIYAFGDNEVHVTLLNTSSTIHKIRVYDKYSGPDAIPTNIDNAMKFYPRLQSQPPDRARGQIFTAPGITVLCDLTSSPQAVHWVEFVECAH